MLWWGVGFENGIETMPADSIALTANARAILETRQGLADRTARLSAALSSGKKVRTVTDDAVAFAAAGALTDRAGQLAAVQDSVGQGVSTINAALTASSSINDLLKQAQGIAGAGLASTDASERAGLAGQYNQVLGQIDALAADAGYQGVNLLSASSSALTVSLGGRAGDALSVSNRDNGSAALGLTAVATDGSGFSAALVDQVGAAVDRNNATQASLGGAVGALSSRAEAANEQAAVAVQGAAGLIDADLGETAAGLLATQTRQQLARVAQGVSQQGQSSLLSLF